MPSNVDHVADVAQNGGVELHRLAKLYTFPDFVKQASPDLHLSIPPGTPLTTCADPVNKQFWCHSAPSTWLSHLFYQEKRAEFHPKTRVQIEKRLEEYAKYHRIKAACDAIKTRWGELHKSAEDKLPDSAYAYVWKGENGTVDRHLPMRSAMEVKAAADYLEEFRDRFPFGIRRTMAVKILEKAASFGAGIKDKREFLEKQAGRGVCDTQEVVEMVEKRARMIPADAGCTFDEHGKAQGGLRAHFLKLAEFIKNAPRQALQPEMLVKLAETIDQLDRQHGLTNHYGKGLERPEEVIFRATFDKVASDLAHHVPTQSGKYYEKEAFRRLPLADVEALFGNEFAKRVQTPLGEIDSEKMAEEVMTLPRPDAQLLDSLLSDNGIVPVMHKAAAAKQGFSNAQMEQIANSYAR